MQNTVLNNFLIKNKLYSGELFDYAKNMTPEQFYNNCDRVDWLIWMFSKINSYQMRHLLATTANCARKVRPYLIDDESLKAVNVALKYESLWNSKSFSKEFLEKIWTNADLSAMAWRNVTRYNEKYNNEAVDHVRMHAHQVASYSIATVYYTFCNNNDEAFQYARFTAKHASIVGGQSAIANIVKLCFPRDIWIKETIS